MPESWFKRLCRNKLGLFAFVTVCGYLLMAAGAEVYAIYCRHTDTIPIYQRENSDERYAAPSPRHWLGTDYMGRDVFWRAVAGSSTAVKVGTVGALISVIIGVALGTMAGYYGGKIDDGVVWLYSVFAAMPTLLFILAFALLVNRGFLSPEIMELVHGVGRACNTDPGTLAIYLAIGLTGWVALCMVVRSETMKLRNRGYVLAAQVAGMRSWRIIWQHILPNVMHLVIIYFTLRFAYAVMTEVIVSFLGVGVQSAPSWGLMIADGQERLWRGIWWEVGAATLFMFFLALALQLLGDTLRDVLDPRQRGRD